MLVSNVENLPGLEYVIIGLCLCAISRFDILFREIFSDYSNALVLEENKECVNQMILREF